MEIINKSLRSIRVIRFCATLTESSRSALIVSYKKILWLCAIALLHSVSSQAAQSGENNAVQNVVNNDHGSTSAPPAIVITQSDPDMIPVGQELVIKRQAWQSALSMVAQKEGATMFFDVSLNSIPPNVDYVKPSGVAAMHSLATATYRIWKQIDGIQTFSRIRDPQKDADIFDDDVATFDLVNWISELKPQDRQSLLNGHLKWDNIDPRIQQLLIKLMVYWDQNSSFAILNSQNRIGLHLVFDPRIEYVEPKSGQLRMFSLHAPDMFLLPSIDDAQSSNSARLESLQHPEPGPLDFGPGVVLPLGAIIARAYKTFHTYYTLDGRVSRSHYFVSGKYTREGFATALREVATVAQTQEAPPLNENKKNLPSKEQSTALYNDLLKSELSDLRNQFVDVAFLRQRMMSGGRINSRSLDQKYSRNEFILAQKFLDNNIISVADLTKDKPGLETALAQLGLQPDMKVTLRPGILLIMQSKNEVDLKIF